MSAGKPKRRAILALAALGIALIAMPAVFQMFDRAPKGARMITAFHPYMTPARLSGYQTEMGQINAGVREGATKVAARAFGSSTSGGQARFAARAPDFVEFEHQWAGIYPDMSGMLSTIQRNVGNYRAVAALPSFTLFPWFFVIPGLLVLGLLGIGLARPDWWRTIRWVLAALGLGLVLAPAVFQMFSRAPKGGHMMTAFKTIETRVRVQRIQGYFGDMAVGQGAVQLELIPALQRSGLSASEIRAAYPAITTFNDQWVHILNDMTPMIGAMSDNVGNYQAVAALPPFPLFPWFFVLPGLLLVGVALAARPQQARRTQDAPSQKVSSSLPEGVS
jgi:hypothetical protein